MVIASRTFGIGLGLLGLLTTSGCAEPCIDDGLGQKYCPPDDAQTGTEGTEISEDPTAAEDGCALLDVILIPQTPTLVLLVDQSLSMEEDFGGDTRWNVITNVLIDPQAGIVAQFDAGIRFGLTLYSSIDGDLGGECPLLVEVDPATDNFPAIETTMNMSVPIGDTPTGESLDLTWQKLDTIDVPGRKYIVLATDGEPDTCAEPNPSNGQPQSIAAAEAAFAAGIETFVISVGSDVSADHLQDMANAGQGVAAGDPDAAYYQALDQAALVDAFGQILAGVRSCTLDLDTSIDDQVALGCTVEVNGDVVGYEDANGWQLNTSTEVELLGSACDALQQGTSSVQMDCACADG